MNCLLLPTARALALMLLPVLVACTPEVDDDLRAWTEQRRRMAPEPAGDMRSPPVAASFMYDAAGRRDPFDAASLTTELSATELALRPDAGRPRDVLEAFSLDSLQMVGVLIRAGHAIGVVQAERELHQVRVGDHLGQDYGEVTAITEDGIAIAERVQDSQGQWQRRRVLLAMRRGSSK